MRLDKVAWLIIVVGLLVSMAILFGGCAHPTSEWQRAFAPLSAETTAERECRDLAARATGEPAATISCLWLSREKLCRCQGRSFVNTEDRAFVEKVEVLTLTPCGEVIE